MRRTATVLYLSFLVLLSTSGCAWFVLGGVGAGVYYLDKMEEQSAPAVSIENPQRLKTSPGAIAYTLFDDDGDSCSVTVEVSMDGGVWQAATPAAGGEGTAGLAASQGGALHVFTWDFDSDMTAPEADVRVRITPDDGEAQGEPGETPPFVAGNVPPTITNLEVPSNPVTGTATLSFEIEDTQSDVAEIEVEYHRTTGDTTWYPTTEDPSGSSASSVNLSSSPSGEPHVYPWDSDYDSATRFDLPGEDATVRVRVRASDDGDDWSPWQESDTFVIRNDSEPVVTFGDVTTVVERGVVTIPYLVKDAESDDVTILVEYRAAGTPAWRMATAGPGTTGTFLTATPAGVSGVYAWDTIKDRVRSTNVTVRITASQDNKTGIPATQLYAIGNNASPTWGPKAHMPTTRYRLACAEAGGLLYAIGGFSGMMLHDDVEAYDPVSDTWASKASMNSTREMLATAVVGGVIYAIGGKAGAPSATVEAYDPALDQWTSRAPMPTARHSLSCAVADGRIYAVGGTGAAELATVEEYDPGPDTWVSKKSMTAARTALCCSAVQGRIYAVGGFDSGFLSTVEEYDPALDSWTTKTSMPTERGNFASAGVNGSVIVVGGANSSGYLSSVEEYHPASDTWTTGIPLPTVRADHGGGVIDDCLYAVGGRISNFQYVDTVEAYQSVPDRWTVKTSMPTARKSFSSAPLQGNLYAIGGYESADLTRLEAYSPGLDAWSTKAPMSFARQNPGTAVVGGHLYALGGFAGGALAVVEEYDPGADAWATKNAMPTARYDFGCSAVDGRIYVIGGENSTPGYLATVEEYDPALDAWATRAPLPTARHKLSTAVVGGRIYAIGGSASSTTFDAMVEEYDPVLDTWATKAPMPTGRQDLACASMNGRIYAIGGYNGADLATVEEYDPVSDTWTTRNSILSARHGFSMVALDGRFYVLGGLAGSMPVAVPTVEVQAFLANDPEFRPLASPSPGRSSAGISVLQGMIHASGGKDGSTALGDCAGYHFLGDIPSDDAAAFAIRSRWAAQSAMNTVRYGAGFASHGGLLYAVGGFDASGDGLASIETYDASADAWTVFSPSLPNARGGLGVVVIDDKLYAFGGDDGAGAKTDALEMYDFTTSAWSTGTSMGTPRSHFGYAVEPETERIYVFGGEGAGGAYLDSVEYYEPATDTWRTSEDAVNPLNTLPRGLKGVLCLFEGFHLKLFGGEYDHALDGPTLTRQILVYDHWADRYGVEARELPYPARDMFGCSATGSWNHRGNDQTDRFCFLGGGVTGTHYHDAFFRFYSR